MEKRSLLDPINLFAMTNNQMAIKWISFRIEEAMTEMSFRIKCEHTFVQIIVMDYE